MENWIQNLKVTWYAIGIKKLVPQVQKRLELTGNYLEKLRDIEEYNIYFRAIVMGKPTLWTPLVIKLITAKNTELKLGVAVM